MFGVVLWSDEKKKQAVIWCEDHGELAFYKGRSTDGLEEIEAGDLVEFDLHQDDCNRIITNLNLVAVSMYPTLANKLQTHRSPSEMYMTRPVSPRAVGHLRMLELHQR